MSEAALLCFAFGWRPLSARQTSLAVSEQFGCYTVIRTIILFSCCEKNHYEA